MNYQKKRVTNLNPSWFLALSKQEKVQERIRIDEEEKYMWNQKPEIMTSGSIITASKSTNSITENRKYVVINYFATLVTTIYASKWNQFVTIKNDSGFTVKMNLDNFKN